jgi:VWFA-related protein
MPCRNGLAVIALTLPGTLALPAGDRPAAQTPTFRAAADAVRVDVAVRQGARVVEGLTAKDFELLDNGVRQQISEVSYGQLPIDVTVGLDVGASGSGMRLQQLQQAIVQLMRHLRTDDRLRLILFDTQVVHIGDFTSDVRAVENAIGGVQAGGGGTGLFDALHAALTSAPAADRRQLVMFFTGGMESHSRISADLLHETARRATATVSFLVASAGARGPGPASPTVSSLVRIAQETGGASIFTSTTADLSTPFRTILERFRLAYVLYYSPRGVDQPGFHTLDVRVKRPRAVVTARRGYVR